MEGIDANRQLSATRSAGAYAGAACEDCAARGICRGGNAGVSAWIESLQPLRCVIRRGSHLCRANTELRFLYAVHSGSLKSSIVDQAGHEQVVGYHIGRELLGMEGIDTGKHICDVVALEDCVVCKIPFAALQTLCRQLPELQSNLHRTMGREIGRGYVAIHALSVPSSNVRLANFLLGLSERYSMHGEPATHFRLSIKRKELASLLGLELETVSRALSRLRDARIIEVCGRNIEIKSVERLQQIL